MALETTERKGRTALTEKYRPRTLAELIGQPAVVEQLAFYLEDPYPTAFLFAGETGTGKTSAGLILARALGVDLDHEYGGLHRIASGDHSADAVREVITKLAFHPWAGSGWRVVLADEADAMSTVAAALWLDALEQLPPKTVIVFTTNAPEKLPQRIRDRCERLDFSSRIDPVYLQRLIDFIWENETGELRGPDLSDLPGIAEEAGHISIRRALQQLQPWTRLWRRT